MLVHNQNEKQFILQEGEMVCNKCDGEGRLMDDFPYIPCPKCKGQGIIDWVKQAMSVD